MNLFSNLFGRNKNKHTDNKINIDALLASPNTNNSVIELDNYICKLCSWGDAMESLSQPQKNFYFNQNLEREINNGGFNQYFHNSTGEFAHETIVSLDGIGANKTSVILQQAINQFPGSNVPKERDERQEILQQIEAIANIVWEELDQKFYTYEDNLNELNIKYIKQNRTSF